MPNSHSKGEDRPDSFQTTDNEETTPMDCLESFLHEDTIDELSELNSPEADLRDFSREDLPPLTEGEYFLDPDLEAEPEPQAPSEEEAIEKAFHDAVEKEDAVHPFLAHLSALWAAHKKTVLVSGCSVALALALGIGGVSLVSRFSDPYHHRILDNVTLAGVDIGGMTRSEAQDAVSQAADQVFSQNDMVVVLPEKTLAFSPAQTEVSADVKSAVKEAYRYGRSGSKAEKKAAYERSLTETYAVSLLPYLKVNDQYIKDELSSYISGDASGFTPSSYALEGERPPLDLKNFNEDNPPQTLLLILGTPGNSFDINKVYEQILEAYSTLNMRLIVDMNKAGTVPDPLDLEKIHQEYTIEPIDSALDMDNYRIVPGSYGYSFDLENAQKMLDQAKYGDTVRIPMEYEAPAITDEDVMFRDVLASAQTPHGTDENRNTNLRLACEALDGLILYPGDEFSYNETLGQRTSEKGYKPAPAYSGNTLVDSIGGGICQVSSTLYYSAMLADMEITDRINHGFLPTYISPGMDATVSWGNPDFKFKNSSHFPIKIQAETTSDQVKIQILGTNDKDYYVKMEYEDSVTLAKEVYEEHSPGSGYEDGDLIQAGIDRHYVTTYRCKYDKQTDQLISRDVETHSSYMGRDTIYASVPKVEKPEPPTPPEPTVPTPTMPPEPTKPTPTEPAPTEPAPTEPAPTQPPEPPQPEPPAPPEPEPQPTVEVVVPEDDLAEPPVDVKAA